MSQIETSVDSDDNIHEEFLGFQNLQRITGEAIVSSILDTLPQWNLDIKIVGDKGAMERLICRSLGAVHKH